MILTHHHWLAHHGIPFGSAVRLASHYCDNTCVYLHPATPPAYCSTHPSSTPKPSWPIHAKQGAQWHFSVVVATIISCNSLVVGMEIPCSAISTKKHNPSCKNWQRKCLTTAPRYLFLPTAFVPTCWFSHHIGFLHTSFAGIFPPRHLSLPPPLFSYWQTFRVGKEVHPARGSKLPLRAPPNPASPAWSSAAVKVGDLSQT